jgi:hypothetical protein
MLRILLFVSLLVASLSCEAAEEDTVLYRFRNETLRTSKYGPIAALQKALEQGLQACTPPGPHVSSDGAFGQGTSTAIKTFARCHHFSQPLPQNSAARTGAITTLLWKELLPTSAAPSAEQRANDLTLVFEATDYTA